MRYLGWIFGIVLFLVLTLAGLERLAAERVEVVQLHAVDAQGEIVTTRLWVVDHDGGMYLRVGADGSGWYSRLLENPNVEVTRGEVTGQYTAISKPMQSDAVNQLMQDKYTWGDTFIGALVGSREGSIPILLEPTSP